MGGRELRGVGLVRGVKCGAERYRGIGVAELWFLSEDAADGGLDAGHAASAAGEEDAGKFAAVEAGPQQHAFAGHLGLGDKSSDGGFKFGPRHLDVHAPMLGGTQRETDGLAGGEPMLEVFGVGLGELAVTRAEFVAGLCLKLGGYECGEFSVKVFPSESLHAFGEDDLNGHPLGSHERDVEGAAAEIKDRIEAIERLLLAARIGEGRRGRLVDHVHLREARAARGLEGGFAGGVREVRGDGDDCQIDGAMGGLRVGADLAEEEGREVEGRDALAEDRVRDARAHIAFEFQERVFGILGHRAGFAAHDDVGGGLKAQGRRRDGFAFPVADDFGGAGLVDARDDGRRGAEVDAEEVSHP